MPENCNDVNVNGILNAARRMDVEKIIYASRSSVNGDSPTLPIREDMHRLPISPYGVAKLTCEAYMQVYHQVIRYFNVFGSRQKNSAYSGIIAIWLGNVIRNEDLIIFGDGKNSRDFTYIKDVIQANLLAAKQDVPGEIFNIGRQTIKNYNLPFYILSIKQYKILQINK